MSVKGQLIIDSREPAGLKLKLISMFGAEEIAVKKLDFGDYLLPSGLLIERKTISDFLTSVGDGRLDHQLLGCANSSDGHCALLLEGVWSVLPTGSVVAGHRRTGWAIKSFIRKLEAVQGRYGCLVLPSPSLNTTTQIIKALM